MKNKLNIFFLAIQITLTLFLVPSSFIFAQSGPGGVGTNNGTSTLRMWWRADAGVTSAGGLVSAWADQSGYANGLTQATNNRRPTITTSVSLNNQSIIRYNPAPVGQEDFFNSAFSGPNVDNITLFLVANGTSYQSLFRWQNNAGIFVVYPWEGAGRIFISSSDGGTGSGVATGIVNSVNNVAGARYRRNTANGMQTYLNGGINAQRASANAVLPNQPFFSGRYNLGASEYPNCDARGSVRAQRYRSCKALLWNKAHLTAVKGWRSPSAATRGRRVSTACSRCSARNCRARG